jgi:hypothetical protein
MKGEDLAEIVRKQIGGNWSRSNWHGVDLAHSLVSPTKISVIDRRVSDGTIKDKVIPVWLVLEESVEKRDGYKIVFDEKTGHFGLATPGFSSDAHPVLCGWYGDFMTTFEAM